MAPPELVGGEPTGPKSGQMAVKVARANNAAPLELDGPAPSERQAFGARTSSRRGYPSLPAARAAPRRNPETAFAHAEGLAAPVTSCLDASSRWRDLPVA